MSSMVPRRISRPPLTAVISNEFIAVSSGATKKRSKADDVGLVDVTVHSSTKTKSRVGSARAAGQDWSCIAGSKLSRLCANYGQQHWVYMCWPHHQAVPHRDPCRHAWCDTPAGLPKQLICPQGAGQNGMCFCWSSHLCPYSRRFPSPVRDLQPQELHFHPQDMMSSFRQRHSHLA